MKKECPCPVTVTLPALALLFGFTTLQFSILQAKERALHFNRDIRPILSENCFQCHGFDRKHRKAGLRLDEREGATAELESGNVAIVPGDADASKILHVLTSDDPDVRMPPPDTDKKISQDDLAKLRQWIDAGAVFEKHWAFVPPQKTNTVEEGMTPIDTFVRARLAASTLKPNPPADPATLYRRLSLDLTGLPPTPGEVDAFVAGVAKDRKSAFREAVTRLLESPHFGEKWARWWMDSAHYADTAGYSIDYERPHAWRWRDWVVEALNRNQPFDQFTIEQIAGDLLPRSTTKQKIATGFFRQTLSNREGGADLEEFRVKQLKDRTVTLGATWLGLTLECCECHDHKFDPLTQRDFYSLYAFFNNTDEINLDAPLPGEAEAREAARENYRRERATLIAPVSKEIEPLQAEWERRILEAERKPGLDYKWDRQLELLGILWGKGEGEGQLEGLRIVKTPPDNRTREQEERLHDFFLQYGRLGQEKEYDRLKLSEIKSGIAKLNEKLPGVSRPATLTAALHHKETTIQNRGDFRVPGETVSADVPEFLPDLDNGKAPDRLDLAHWVASRENPLTARVIVNRVWHELFGLGLVATTEDFGTKGRLPSHPDLLDWLAVEFVESGWDLKGLIRTIISSQTYQQSSIMDAEMVHLDPDNELLARHPRLRLTGELVRDSALSVSGLLVREMGGPSVRPPQPDGVSMEGSYKNKWKASEGKDRYRRGIYTFLQRISPFAQYQTFDLPNVNRTCTRRGRSNTPLQALTLLNDPVFVEAAEALAQRVTSESKGDDRARIQHGFRLALGRKPETGEIDRLERYRSEQLDIFKEEGVENPDQSSWVAVASALLNLDEFITKE